MRIPRLRSKRKWLNDWSLEHLLHGAASRHPAQRNMRNPAPTETIIHDPSNERIDWLVNDYFSKVADSIDGWSTLYRDPSDDRYWELSYPESGLHGGGPPRLAVIDANDATLRYGVR